MSTDGTLRVLHVVPSFYPAMGFGGPVVSNYHLCNELARRSEIELRVLTTDTSGPAAADRLEPGNRASTLYAGYRVHFCRKLFGTAIAPGVLLRIWRDVAWADVVHVTAVYSFTTIPALFASRILGKPVVLSPHGALQRWKGTRMPLLKRMWNRVCKSLMRRDMTTIQATSTAESAASRAAIPGIPCEVIPHGVAIAALPQREWRPDGRLRLLFLGRLDPIKGIENLLDALAILRGIQWSLRICGDGEAGYAASLRAHCANRGIEKRVMFSSFVDGPEKEAAFLGADLCVVPSFSENFAMVVAESLALGTPVIASTGTPWQELDSRGAGRWVENDPSSLAAAIVVMSNANLAEMGRKGREWMTRDYTWPVIAKTITKLYGNALARTGRSAA